MVVRKAYKFRLYPTRAQETRLNETLETCREVYNSFLHWRRYDYDLFKTCPSYRQQRDALPGWKKQHPELRAVHSQVLQNVCERVDIAYQSYFDRLADYQLRKEQGRLKIIHNELDRRAGISPAFEKCPGPPRPKGRGSYDSLTYTQAGGFTLGDGCITFSKLATIKAVLHRAIAGVMKTATIRRQSGKWFVTLSCIEEAEPLPESDASIGIDVGIEHFATFSDDTKPIENPRFFRTEQKALAKAQRKFDQVKNQHRTPQRRKAKKVITRVHERIRNKRHNFHHQEARKIVDRYGIITIEKLNIVNMSQSPAPKQDELSGVYLPNGHAAKAGLISAFLMQAGIHFA
jgi:putative transposase